MAGASFELSLVNKVSAASAAAKVSIIDVTAAVQKLQKAQTDAAATEVAKGVLGMKTKAMEAAEAAALKNTANEAGGLADKFKELTSSALPTEGALGKVVQSLAALGPAGLAVAAVLAVVATAVMATVGALYQMAAAAISISQEKDALNATFAALAGGKDAAEAVNNSIDKLGAVLPQSKDLLEGWAKSLLSAGIQGAQLEASINGIASAQAMMGDGGAAAAEKMAKTLALGGEAAAGMMKQIQAGGRKSAVLLAEMGLQSADLAKALGVTPEKFAKMTLSAEQMGEAMNTALVTKGAGALETMGLTWKSISGKMATAWGSMFEGLTTIVTPFMTEVKGLFSEFFEGGIIVDGAGALIKAVLTKVFAVATVVVHALHTGFLMVEIAALKVAIAIAPVVMWIKKMAGNATLLEGLFFILKAIGVVVLAIVGPFIIVGAALLALGAIFIATLTAIQAAVLAAVAFIVGAFLWCVGDAVRAFGVMGDTISGWASSAYDAAANFISGLVNGIKAGASTVIAAVKNLASGALGAFTGFFTIQSPSRVMMKMGGYVAEGAAIGIDAGADRVATAAEDMGSGALGGAAGGMSGGKGGRGGAGASVVFEKGAIQIDGAGKSAMEITEEMFAMVFERLAASQGLMVAR